MGARIARSVLLVLVALGLSLWVGCAPGAREAAAPAKKEEPKYGGIFQFTPAQALTTLDPYFTAGVDININLRSVYETLVQFKQSTPDEDYRATGEVEPWLAERWEQPNPTTYVFYLRKGVKWHDGVEFTADDVVFSFDRLMDPKNNFARRGMVGPIEDITAQDKYTVRFKLKRPDAEFLILIAESSTIPITAKHVADQGEDFKKVAIGTGPFKLKSFDRTKGTTQVRNEEYWQKGKPYLDGIRTIFGLEKGGITAALKTRENDYYIIADKKQFDTIYAVTPDLQYHEFFSNYNYGFRFKLDKPPYNDVRVRRAVNLAVDRQEMVKTLGFGKAVINHPAVQGIRIPLGWGIPEEEFLKMPGWRQPKDADLAEAKRLLTEAGYPQGFKTSLDYYATYTLHPGISEMVAGQLKRIGIEVTALANDIPTCTKKYQDGDYELSMCGQQMFYNFNSFLPNNWQSTGAGNKAGLSDPELDRLIDAQSLETDVVKRKKLIEQIDRLFVERVYFVPAVDVAMYSVWQPYLHNMYQNYASQAWPIRPRELWMEVDKMPAGRTLD